MNSPAPVSRATAPTPIVQRGDSDGIALLVLNRPQTRNTLSEAMMTALSETFSTIAADKRVRAVVLLPTDLHSAGRHSQGDHRIA
jgi:enoyl-CoA hydratase/carnithine racemase